MLLLLCQWSGLSSGACCLCQEAVDRSGQETAEATRALPEAMTAALSAALQKANQPMMLPSTDQVDGQPAFQVSSLASESQQQLRLLVSEELACAVQQINSAQVCFFTCSYMESGLQSSSVTKLTTTPPPPAPNAVCVPSFSPPPPHAVYVRLCNAFHVSAARSYDQATLFHEEYGSWSHHQQDVTV